MSADEILHEVWSELHRSLHATGASFVLSSDESRLYDLLTKRLIKSVEEDTQAQANAEN
jgi:hypothetical protein